MDDILDILFDSTEVFTCLLEVLGLGALATWIYRKLK